MRSTNREGHDKHVMHLVPALFGADDGVFGGAERYALELARHMSEATPTRLVSFGSQDREESVDNLRIRVIGNPWYVRGQRTNPLSTALLPELTKADIVHCHQQRKVASSLAALACRLKRKRVFVSDHGGGGWDFSAYISTDRWYHGHLHVSEFSRNICGQTEKAWAHVIFAGVDTLKFCPDESVAPTGTVLFVGRLLPHKGVNDLIEAAGYDLTVEVISRDYDSHFLESLRTLATGKRVCFRHECDDAELISAYRQAMCVVLPSVYQSEFGGEATAPELLGQTLLESMACGTPAICTNVAGMPEVVKDGVTGFVVPPNDPKTLGDRLRWLKEHPTESAQMGRAARQYVLEKFTWPGVVQRCLEIYDS
jgi:glycosyltransferase involved in cell wall biosynthesis